MKNIITILLIMLFSFTWNIYVYSGDSGRIIYTSKEQPQFIYEGRWIYFTNIKTNENVIISNGSTVIIKHMEN